jgi:hypothetical protein
MMKDEEAGPPPHYLGHRERLRERFRKGGADALAEYELIELILFRAMPRRDVKPLAKTLVARFGSFAGAVSARPERLREIEGLGEAAIVELKTSRRQPGVSPNPRSKTARRSRAFPPSSIIAAPRWPSSITKSFAYSFSTKRTI